MGTIFALSSGSAPAGIAVIRITGPDACLATKTITGGLPPPRFAKRCTFTAPNGTPLDDGLVLWFPGPQSVTGEDLAEFHVHGGRAVIAAIEDALASISGLRLAEPGEFTRRAFANGKLDLAEAEGLADLLSAETELQRRSAMVLAGGGLSRKLEDWRQRLLALSAQVEASLDFEEEDDVIALGRPFYEKAQLLLSELSNLLASPPAEVLREGFRVAIAGPPNAGKSTLFNALTQSEAAIATSIAGTTRDVLTRSVSISGVPFTFVDMAGLRDDACDPVETIGIDRAREEIARADVVLWLGDELAGPAGSIEIEAQCDRNDRPKKRIAQFRISAKTGEGLSGLISALVSQARSIMPRPGEFAINRRQRRSMEEFELRLKEVITEQDPLIIAEILRASRYTLDQLTGRTATEDVLDTLFGRFCIGK